MSKQRDTPTDAVIELARLVAPLDDVKRVTKLPSGSYESDSHHSLSLALICHLIASRYCPELNAAKVMHFALVHDLLEIITGDESTLMHDEKAHRAKKEREQHAAKFFAEQFAAYPEILQENDTYEKLDCAESAFVYVMDKACTVWTHFFDDGKNLRQLGIMTRVDIDQWYERLTAKIHHNLKATPPEIAFQILKESFIRMRQELLDH